MATYHYHYDPLDRLIQTAGIQRFYNQSRITTEIEGTQRYSVFQQDGRLLAQRRRDRTKDECHLLGTDLQQSVLHAVGADKHHSMAYNAYGHRPVENGLISLLGFNGERADPVTGHYLLGNGYRAFNPVLMRFNSPDSWSPFERGGANRYAYGLDDPVNLIDTDGHAPFAFLGGRILQGLNTEKFLRRARKSLDPKVISGHRSVIKTFDSIQEIMPDIYIAGDYNSAGRRLNIHAHGSYTQGIGGMMKSGNKNIFPERVYEAVKKSGFGEFDTVRLISCHSGDMGFRSFAYMFAKLTKRRVKGYEGGVWSGTAPRQIALAFRQQMGRDLAITDQVSVLRKNVTKKKYFPSGKVQKRHRSRWFDQDGWLDEEGW